MRRIFCAVLMFALSATAVLAQATTGASDDDRRGAIGVLPVGDPATLGPATIGPATIDDVDPPPAEAAITVALGGPAAASDVASVLGYIPCNPANCTLGQLNNGVAASFTQLSGQPVATASTLASLVEGTPANYVTSQGYSTPMVNLERHDGTTQTNATSDWGNDRLSPMLLITDVAGPNNVNNPNGAAIQMEDDFADVAGPAYPITGLSILTQCNPRVRAKCRDMDPLNLVMSWASGTAPANMTNEIDSIPLKSATLTRPGAGGNNFGAVWAQAAGNGTASSGAFYCSNSTPTNGWNWCVLAEGNFYDYAIYVNNTLNGPTAKGLYVNTAYAGAAGTVASLGANGIPLLTLDGAGDVKLRNPVGVSLLSVTTASARFGEPVSAPAFKTGSAAGANCTGPPSSDFTVAGGLVTHC